MTLSLSKKYKNSTRKGKDFEKVRMPGTKAGDRGSVASIGDVLMAQGSIGNEQEKEKEWDVQRKNK